MLTSMEEAGLPPGPRAYHGLICAHCKAGDTDSALATVRKAVQQGEPPRCCLPHLMDSCSFKPVCVAALCT